MSFPPAFLDDIRNRLTLSAVVGSRVRLTRAGREFKGCCPFHNEKSPSFYVNDDKQFFHCFGCGAHGDVIGFTMRHGNLSFPDAIETLAGEAGLQVPRDTPVEREKFDQHKRLLQLLERATVWFETQLTQPHGREAQTYLHGRGLSDDAIRRFRLGYAPADGQSLIRALTGEGFKIDELIAVGLARKSEDRPDIYGFFRNRVIFPVGDHRGHIVAFGARILGEGEPKYLNSPDHILFHKGKLLYGLSRARAAQTQGQPIIVVEGYMDVIALAEAGYMGAVAPLGTALTDDQLQILWKLAPAPDNRVAGRDYSPILCFDGDTAGQRAIARTVERALPLLTSAQTLRAVTIVGAKDPDELIRQGGKGAFETLLAQAQPMIELVWQMTQAGRQLRTPEERGAFKAALRQRASRIADASLRELYDIEFRRRIDAAFGWQPRAAAPGASQDGGKQNWQSWKDRQSGKPAISQMAAHAPRRGPPDARRLMERVLLAVMLNHAHLFEEFGEELANAAFAVPELEKLRRHLVEILLDHDEAVPDRAAVFRQLAERGIDPDRVLGDDLYLTDRACRPDADPAAARALWQDRWRMREIDHVRADYAAACAACHERPDDDAALQRMEALRQRLMTINEQDNAQSA